MLTVMVLWHGLKFQETAQGVILDVYVKPSSKEFKLIIDENELLVMCREAPVKGKVNKELMKQFSQLFACKVELVSGFTSRQKRLLISGIEAKEVYRILASVSGTC